MPLARSALGSEGRLQQAARIQSPAGAKRYASHSETMVASECLWKFGCDSSFASGQRWTSHSGSQRLQEGVQSLASRHSDSKHGCARQRVDKERCDCACSCACACACARGTNIVSLVVTWFRCSASLKCLLSCTRVSMCRLRQRSRAFPSCHSVAPRSPPRWALVRSRMYTAEFVEKHSHNITVAMSSAGILGDHPRLQPRRRHPRTQHTSDVEIPSQYLSMLRRAFVTQPRQGKGVLCPSLDGFGCVQPCACQLQQRARTIASINRGAWPQDEELQFFS